MGYRDTTIGDEDGMGYRNTTIGDEDGMGYRDTTISDEDGMGYRDAIYIYTYQGPENSSDRSSEICQ